jgi:glutamine amidotransferase
MAQKFLAVVDYKAGNQTSVHRALRRLNVPAEVTASPERLREAAGVVFPGVGAAGQAMGALRESGLDTEIKALVELGRPFLGICLGCQIMLERSEENETETLGVFPGETVRFPSALKDERGNAIRIPHMGWNTLRVTRESALFAGLGPQTQFYFVHSYHPSPPAEFVMAETFYGAPFCSVFGREGVWAVQFHPEKSGPAGLRMLENFWRHSLEKGGAA